MNCPSCGARMTDGAQWCGLCLQPLAAAQEVAATAPPAPAPSPVDHDPAALAAAAQAWEALTGPPPEAVARTGPEPVVAQETGRYLGEHRMVVLDTGERGWVCRLCDHAQPLAEATCPACGTSLLSVESDRVHRPTGNPARALLWSVIPGGGQWYLGLHAQALARASLILLTFVAAISFPARGALGALRLATALLCALLWIVSAIDARAVARQGPAAALLTDRRLMWVAMGVTVLLVGAVVLALLMGTVSGGAGAAVSGAAGG
ncbi:MAG: hypothetical protein K1X95_10595 [Acidimicrobiia bacterium]|nr:hypothetical protein [Acidimicrobiia bacterium]